jgi:hypothetical protein
MFLSVPLQALLIAHQETVLTENKKTEGRAPGELIVVRLN